AVPFFAVVAGPVLAWNLHDVFARWPRPAFSPWRRAIAAALAPVAAAALLLAAWPGWLQHPPFEPRRWAVETPAGLEQAAVAVRRGPAERAWPPGTRTLHLSRDTAAAFAWFCPEDDGILGPGLEPAHVGRVVVHSAQRGPSRVALTRLLADPDRWP